MTTASKYQKLHERVTRLHKKAADDLQQKHADSLSYLKKKTLLLPGLQEKTKKLLTGATLVSSLLLNPINLFGGTPLLDKPAEERLKIGLITKEELQKLVREKITGLLPGSIGKLTLDEEAKICEVLKQITGIDVCARYEGNELNYAYGWIGYEQHLYRYPSDDLEQHSDELVAGIAPGLGAWGYFSDSQEAVTEDQFQKEKYYAVVQTLYLPEWETRTEELYQWYQYRKVLIVNPENGTACVAAIGDAGPAAWTGKQFGGSPETMKALDLHLGPRKGQVLLLFIKDPDNKIPLGPVSTSYQGTEPQGA